MAPGRARSHASGPTTRSDAISFRIHALPRAPFEPLFALSDAALLAGGIHRRIADADPGFPCRISLQDAGVGERVLLLNYEHQPAGTPYRSRHAIFIRENAVQAQPGVGEVPAAIARRLLSVRAFDAQGLLVDADVVEGKALAPRLATMFSNPAADEIHLHHARQGCYAARVARA